MRDYFKILRKGRALAKQLGYRSAAGYLRNRQVDFQTAYITLFDRLPRV